MSLGVSVTLGSYTDVVWGDLVDRAKTKSVWFLNSPFDMMRVLTIEGSNGAQPRVAMRLDLPNGDVVIAETSVEMFLTVAETMRGRYARGKS